MLAAYRIRGNEGTIRASSDLAGRRPGDNRGIDLLRVLRLLPPLPNGCGGLQGVPDAGWPSFTRPIQPDVVHTKSDRKLWMERNEVRSAGADSHLGHVFDDGPAEAGGLRYCMNSAALRFIPVAELEAQGFGEYRSLFDITDTAEENAS